MLSDKPIQTKDAPPENTNVGDRQISMVVQSLQTDLQRDFSRLFEQARSSGRDLENQGLLPKLKGAEGDPVTGRDNAHPDASGRGRPTEIMFNGRKYKVEYSHDPGQPEHVTRIVDGQGRTLIDGSKVKGLAVASDGKISFEKAGQKVEIDPRAGSTVATSTDGTHRVTRDSDGNRRYETGDGKGNYQLVGLRTANGTNYRVDTDPFNPGDIMSVTRLGADGKLQAKVSGGEISIDGKGHVLQQLGNNTLVYDDNLKVSAIRGQDGRTVETIGQNAKSVNVDRSNNITIDLGNGSFRSVSAGGERARYTDKADPSGNGTLREITPLTRDGKDAGTSYSFHVNTSTGKITDSTVSRRDAQGRVSTLPVKDGQIVDRQGDRTVMRNANLNITEVQDSKGQTIARVGNDVQSIHIDNKGNVVSELSHGRTRVTTPDGQTLQYRDRPVEGQPGHYERTFSSPPGYTMAVTKNSDGSEQITSVSRNGIPIAEAGKNGIKTIEGIDWQGRVSAKLEDGKTTRIFNPDGKKECDYTERTEGGKTIRTFSSGTEVSMVNGKPVEVSYNSPDPKEKWTIGQDGTAHRTGGQGEPSTLKDARIDPTTGVIRGQVEIIQGNKPAETMTLALRPDGGTSETRTARDAAGHNYEYTVHKDKNGNPTDIEHPALRNGNIIEGTKKTIHITYEQGADGKQTPKQIDFLSQGQEKGLSLIRQADGSWKAAINQMMFNPRTGSMELRTVPSPLDQAPAWKANPQVGRDGSVTLTERSGGITRLDASGEVRQRPGEDLGKPPQTAEEIRAAQERSRIVQVGTGEDGKPIWGQGIPNVSNQWGFDKNDVSKGTFQDRGVMGDQGYTFDRSQVVENGVIQRRETTFNTEKGVVIYYRDQQGQMKSLHNVTSMVSERQSDGTDKTTYHFRGENVSNPNAPKPVFIHTTADGRHITADGMPVGARTDTTIRPNYQTQAHAQTNDQQLASYKNAIKQADLNTEAGRQQADTTARQLINSQMRAEENRAMEAIRQNNQRAQLEAERGRADLEYMLQSERERRNLIDRYRRGEDPLGLPDRPARPNRPVQPVQPPVRPYNPAPWLVPWQPGGT